ncbi:hypothetical protein [Actinophytocola sp.]|jgi:ABC-2 type transport system ATP-binding protein|uniref:hypothetical protein n=1 Tax=Actinophytocola sp. TaxID=1872138 RepID=UPI0039C85926
MSPITGLGPRSRRVVWEMIRGLLADAVIIFLAVQHLEEADQLAQRRAGPRYP